MTEGRAPEIEVAWEFAVRCCQYHLSLLLPGWVERGVTIDHESGLAYRADNNVPFPYRNALTVCVTPWHAARGREYVTLVVAYGFATYLAGRKSLRSN